jgi:nucleobindin
MPPTHASRNGLWEADEIEAVYGMHHTFAQRQSKGEEEHSRKSKLVVDTVLEKLDTDRDGRISLAELEAVGVDALPTFDHLGAEGHHYDIESGTFMIILCLNIH